MSQFVEMQLKTNYIPRTAKGNRSALVLQWNRARSQAGACAFALSGLNRLL
jgi:hypothetical protein